jgi:hypothetical protein
MKQQPVQLSLFPSEKLLSDRIIPTSGKIAWSYSRRSALEQCARRYYFNYFGGKKRTAKAEDRKEDIQFLASLKSRHLRGGEILHLIIKTYFLKAKQGEYWDAGRLIRWGHSLLNKDRAFSRAHVQGIQEQESATLLLEYYYQRTEAEGLYDEVSEKLANALENFAASSTFSEFRHYGCLQSSLIEHSISIQELPYVIDGKIDLAYSSFNNVSIVDWKMGMEDGIGEESLQLSVYALWAIEYFGCSVDAVKIYKAYLGSGTAKEFNLDSDILAAAKARIHQDTERIALMDEYGHQANIDAFTPCFHEAICLTCPFWRLCYD